MKKNRAIIYLVAAICAALLPARAMAASPQTVPSIAALRAGNFANYPVVNVTGFYAGQLVGGGALTLDTSDTTTADNGCTVYVDAASHRFKRPSTTLSAFQCGAKADGSTNDTTAIQAAFTALSVGGTLDVPMGSGCYRILSTLTITKAVTVSGAGCLTWETSGIAGISISASNVSINGITINGSQHASQTIAEAGLTAYGTFRAGLAPVNISKISISNVTVSNWGGFGISLGYISDFILIKNSISDVGYAGIGTVSTVNGVVANNNIKNVGAGFTPGVTNAYGMYFSRATDDSANLTSQPRSSNISVTANVVDNVPTWECYDTHGGNAMTFDSNIGTNCYFGISVGPSNDSTGTSTYSARNVSLNSFSLSSSSAAGAAGAGIVFQGAATAEYSTGSITGGVLSNFGTQTDNTQGGAVLLNRTSGLSITGLSIIKASPACILANTYNDGLSISGVSCTDVWTNDAGVGAAYGISAKGVGNNMTIVGNNFRQIGMSATYLLTTATGRAIRLANAANGSAFVGNNNTNATTYILNDGITCNFGTVTLNGATAVTVANTFVRESSTFKFGIFLPSGTIGTYPNVKATVNGTSFDVFGTAGDVSTYNYEISQ